MTAYEAGEIHFGDLHPVARSIETMQVGASPLLLPNNMETVSVVMSLDGSRGLQSLQPELQDPVLASSMDRALQSIYDVEAQICDHMRQSFESTNDSLSKHRGRSSSLAWRDNSALQSRVQELEAKSKQDEDITQLVHAHGLQVEEVRALLSGELDEARTDLANAEKVCESLRSEIELTWKTQNGVLQDELRLSLQKIADGEAHCQHLADAHGKELAQVRSEFGMQLIEARNKMAIVAEDCRKLTSEIEVLRRAEILSDDVVVLAKDDLQRMAAEKNDLFELRLQAERQLLELESEMACADNTNMIGIEYFLEEQKKNDLLQDEIGKLQNQIQSTPSPRSGRRKSVVTRMHKKDMAQNSIVQNLQQSLDEERIRAERLQSEHSSLTAEHARLKQARLEFERERLQLQTQLKELSYNRDSLHKQLQAAHDRGIDNISLKDMYSSELEYKQQNFEMKISDLRHQLNNSLAETVELKQTIQLMRSSEESLRYQLQAVTAEREESDRLENDRLHSLLKEALAQRDKIVTEKKVLEDQHAMLRIAAHSRQETVDDLAKSETEIKRMRKERDKLARDVADRDQLVQELKLSIQAQSAINGELREITAERDQLLKEVQKLKNVAQVTTDTKLKEAQRKNDELSAELKKVLKRESLAALSLGSEVLRGKLQDVSADRDTLEKENEHMRGNLLECKSQLKSALEQRDLLALDVRKRDERISELTKNLNEARSKQRETTPTDRRRTEPTAYTQSQRFRLRDHETDILEAVALASEDPDSRHIDYKEPNQSTSPNSTQPGGLMADLTEDDAVVEKFDSVHVQPVAPYLTAVSRNKSLKPVAPYLAGVSRNASLKTVAPYLAAVSTNTSLNQTIVFADLTQEDDADGLDNSPVLGEAPRSRGIPMEHRAADRKDTFNDLLENMREFSSAHDFDDLVNDTQDQEGRSGVRKRTASAASAVRRVMKS